jgi:hypothetical protein
MVVEGKLKRRIEEEINGDEPRNRTFRLVTGWMVRAFCVA